MPFRLLASDRTITQISLELGFESSAHLSSRSESSLEYHQVSNRSSNVVC